MHLYRLLELLSDGQYHAEEQLRDTLGLTIDQFEAVLEGLAADCIPIDRVATDGGLRLGERIVLLDASVITHHLLAAGVPVADGIVSILQEVDSTNTFLLELDEDAPFHGRVCLAESQSRGRGRQGRRWVASPYRNIFMSLAWRFAKIEAVAGLSLAVGMAVTDVLRRLGIEDAGVKWPNDIVWHGRKLGGILIDAATETRGSCRVVIGTGLNVRLDGGSSIEGCTDISTALGDDVDRNQLAAELISSLYRMLPEFAETGFAGFYGHWDGYCVTRGRSVTVAGDGQQLTGVMQGIDQNGALVICDSLGREHRFVSAHITMRLNSESTD